MPKWWPGGGRPEDSPQYGQGADQKFVRRVLSESGGTPMRVVDIARKMHEERHPGDPFGGRAVRRATHRVGQVLHILAERGEVEGGHRLNPSDRRESVWRLVGMGQGDASDPNTWDSLKPEQPRRPRGRPIQESDDPRVNRRNARRRELYRQQVESEKRRIIERDDREYNQRTERDRVERRRRATDPTNPENIGRGRRQPPPDTPQARGEPDLRPWYEKAKERKERSGERTEPDWRPFYEKQADPQPPPPGGGSGGGGGDGQIFGGGAEGLFGKGSSDPPPEDDGGPRDGKLW